MTVWCAAYIQRDENGRIQHDANGEVLLGWCSTRTGRGFKETDASVPTRCGYFITLPCGKKKRVPTCPDCIRILAN